MRELIYNKILSIPKNDASNDHIHSQIATIIADYVTKIDEPTEWALTNTILSSRYDSILDTLFVNTLNLPDNYIVRTYEFCNQIGLEFKPKIEKKNPILLIQARVANSTATHPPIGLAMLAGSILDRQYQTRLFAQLKIPPEVVWNFWKHEFIFQILDFQVLSDTFAYEDFLK